MYPPNAPGGRRAAGGPGKRQDPGRTKLSDPGTLPTTGAQEGDPGACGKRRLGFPYNHRTAARRGLGHSVRVGEAAQGRGSPFLRVDGSAWHLHADGELPGQRKAAGAQGRVRNKGTAIPPRPI